LTIPKGLTESIGCQKQLQHDPHGIEKSPGGEKTWRFEAQSP
jgi:hypothetical protein